jgi:ribonuclease G
MISLVIDSSPVMKIGLLYEESEKRIMDIIIENHFKDNVIDQIHNGRVVNVVNSLDGAFVDIGLAQNAFIRRNDLLRAFGISRYDHKETPLNQLVKSGQMIIAQVSKEPYQSKGAQLTTDISIQGKHVIFLPNLKDIKFSKKIESTLDQRKLLKTLALDFGITGGFIIRSAINLVADPVETLTKEMSRLAGMWEKMVTLAKLEQSVKCIYSSSDFHEQLMSKIDFDVVDEFQTASEDTRDFLLKFGIAKNKIKFHKKSLGLWIEKNIPVDQLFSTKLVKASNGVSITVDVLEAFTIVDVNSALFVSDTQKSESALVANLTAADLLNGHVLLNNISGVIIMDLIEMSSEHKKQFIHQVSESYFAKEYGFQVYGFTNLGLFEMTRKREKPSIREQVSLDFEDEELMYWNLNKLYYELNRIKEHTNTKQMTLEISESYFIFLSQHKIFEDIGLSIKLKRLKASNNFYRISSQNIDIDSVI